MDSPLTLKDATDVLGDASRFFVAVYEEFKFKETDLLKGYLDFILHEPVEWIKGFPLKLRTRLSFAKPKAAVIRLLKVPVVIQSLGMEYCSKAHDVIWDTFKKHGDTILEARVKKGFVGAGEATAAEQVSESGSEPPSGEQVLQNTLILEENSDMPVEVEDISEPPTMTVRHAVVGEGKKDWERKFVVLAAAFRAMLSDQVKDSMYNHEKKPTGIAQATLILIEALEHGA
jgi:hypothetical protein